VTNKADGALAAALQHRVGLARYGNGVLQRVISLVNDAETDIVRQIEKRFGSGPIDETHWAGKRLTDLLAQVRAINVEAHTEIANRLGQGLEAQASYEGEWAAELSRRVGVRGSFVTPSAARLKALVYRSPFAGGVLKDTVRRLEASGFERMKRALQIGLVQGESTDQIVRRITGSADLKYADGVTAVNRRGVERIVRTATTHVNVATQREIMAANPALYRGWLFVAVLDERTSLVCMGNSGRVFPVDSGPFPPLHFYCRSTILPLLASNPEDPKLRTYEQWLREQPEALQRQILGKTRFDLWKQGGLNLKHFVDGGRALTIAELKAWDEQAFIRAGLTPVPRALAERPAQLSWESMPGMTTAHMPELHTAPLAQRQEFHNAIERALVDDQGRDIIADRLGLVPAETIQGQGVFQGRVNPGSQGQAYVRLAPNGLDVAREDQRLLNAAEAIRGRLLRQDAAAWHKPVFRPDLTPEIANLVDARIGRTLTEDEAKSVAAVMQRTTGSDFFTPIATRDGFRFLNVPEVTGIPNADFQRLTREALRRSDLDTVEVRQAYASSGYIDNDWSVHPNGEGYRNAIAGTGRRDVQRAADELYARLGPRIARIEDDFARRYGWSVDRSTRFWERRDPAQAVRVAEDLALPRVGPAEITARQPTVIRPDWSRSAQAHLAREHVTAPGVRTGNEWLSWQRPDGRLGPAITDGSPVRVQNDAAMQAVFNNGLDPVDLHHNHPTNGPFSPADMRTLAFNGMRRMYAHGHSGTVYVAELTPKVRAILKGAEISMDGGVTGGGQAGNYMWMIDGLSERRQALQNRFLFEARIPEPSDAVLKQLSDMRSHALGVALRDAGIIRYHARMQAAQLDAIAAYRPLFDAMVKDMTKSAKAWLKAAEKVEAKLVARGLR